MAAPALVAVNPVAIRWLLAGEWRAQPVRMAIAVLAIAVGVALGFAVHLVNSAALGSFESAIAVVSGRADLAVRGRTPAGFDENLYPRIARLPGVAAASPVVELAASWGQLARPGSQATGGRLTLIGLDQLRAAAVTPGLVGIATAGQSGVGSRPAWQLDAVWLSPALARAAGVGTGDQFSLTAAGQQVRLPVAGVLRGAGDDAMLAVADISVVQDRFGHLGRLHRLDLRLVRGQEAAATQAITALLPHDAMAAAPEAEASRADALSRAYRVNLGMLALVALLTGGFLVWSAQALSAARRRGQFALLSVIGLPRRGLAVQLLVEALILGVVGAVLGLLLGHALAVLVVARVGGDLGGGYFAGRGIRLAFPPLAALLFGALGVATALAGSLIPALSAARAAPAPALKGQGDVPDPARAPRLRPGLLLLALGGVAALGPAIAGLPLLGYAAMALLLAGGVALMPALARAGIALLLRLPNGNVPLDLALRRLWASPQAVSLALSGIVASTALMVAMAVMVASFRQSVDDWLVAILPADLYLHLEAAEAGGLGPADQARLAAVPGVAAIHFQRVQPLRLDPARPAVALMAQQGAPAVPMVATTSSAAPAGATAVIISEPMAWTHGWQAGEVQELVIGGQPRRLFVAGVWRDYARQWGAIILPLAEYRRFTGDATATEAAITLASGADARSVQTALAAALPPAVQGQAQFGRPAEMRAVALTIFDRSFAVTYALEVIAILIGLAGVATSFSAQVLARLREFGMLRHIGLARGRILAMLAAEGAGLGLVGALAGVALGLVMALVLVKVVNPQSFHWTMDLALPLPLLGGLVAALVLSAGLTALIAGRRALGQAAVLAVRADW